MERQDLTRLEVTSQPLNAETPLAALSMPLTPSDLVYVRNHFQMPAIEAETWSLDVGGAVESPLNLTLQELHQLPTHSLEMVLECAGNGRKLMDPKPSGTPWGLGAVSRVRFRGTPLAGLLETASISDEAVEILFEGADTGEVAPGRRERFARSLPMNTALSGDALLAWEMNGSPLPRSHGYPLRLVVPGWYGMASVKWLQSIRALTHTFTGFFQAEHYVYWQEDDAPDGEPVRLIRPRALILSPADGESLSPGRHSIEGVAWSGRAPIAEVLLSINGGETWRPAEISPPTGPHTMQTWRVEVELLQPARYDLAARARDEAGNRQPETMRKNRLGYGNNRPHAISVPVT